MPREGERLYQSYDYRQHSLLNVFINPFATMQEANDEAIAQNYDSTHNGLTATIAGKPYYWKDTEWVEDELENYQIIPKTPRANNNLAMTGEVVWFWLNNSYVGGYSLQDDLSPQDFNENTVDIRFGF